MTIQRNVIICLMAMFFLAGCSQKSDNKNQLKESNQMIKEPSNEKKMKIGIIIETKEPEKAWNAFRFAVTSLKQGHEVKVFLMGEAVECQEISHNTFDVQAQMRSFAEHGGTILACGTCIKSRNMSETEMCPISTMIDCVEMVEWADKVLTF